MRNPPWYESIIRGAYETNRGECSVLIVPNRRRDAAGTYSWLIGRGDLAKMYNVHSNAPVQGAVVKAGQAETMGGAKRAALAAAKRHQSACRTALGPVRR